jgi:hypothetical protein
MDDSKWFWIIGTSSRWYPYASTIGCRGCPGWGHPGAGRGGGCKPTTVPPPPGGGPNSAQNSQKGRNLVLYILVGFFQEARNGLGHFGFLKDPRGGQKLTFFPPPKESPRKNCQTTVRQGGSPPTPPTARRARIDHLSIPGALIPD